jgi:Rod binding domain-containing protein
MSFPIQAPAGVVAAAEGADAGDKRSADAAKAGRDFEAILVRQMLSSTRVAGKGGYGDMAIEALATAVTSAGGLGMGRTLEQALSAHTVADRARPPEAKPLAPTTTAPAADGK